MNISITTPTKRHALSFFLFSLLSLIFFHPNSFAQSFSALPPDITVAQDSTGDFSNITAALASLENTDSDRIIIFIRDGVYTEQILINRPNVTLRGESRKGTRIEYDIPRRHPEQEPAALGRGVVNIFADGIILENLTIENTYPFRRHTFALFGRGTLTLTQNCDFIAEGNDTVALWARGGGLYYHANCHFQGNIDYLCPRGWAYVTNSTFYEVDTRAALWHDGGKDPRKKLVIKDSFFDGAKNYALGRYPRDSQFYLISCRFSANTQDILDTNAPDKPTDDFRWGRRAFFHDCHREGGDAPWHANNLQEAAGAPAPKEITAAWTFDGRWDPERTDAPTVTEVRIAAPDRVVEVVFSEPVTVRGNPVLKTKKGQQLRWTEVNGTNTLTFALLNPNDIPASLTVEGGTIFASLPTTHPRLADLQLKPVTKKANRKKR
ncbi:pectinesterase family protein [Pontibacter sp. 13R65]|uniref:pectinesterase family protein n=1 Tax=Pontibacter sp. 13R65 TaxID=3127458 RepID=UPI00301CA8BA